MNKFHKSLIAFAELIHIDIFPLVRVWSDIYRTRLKHRGKADAVKFMKELNTVAERYALHQPITPLPWTKSDTNGFPKLLNPFKTYLRSEDKFKVILALSVMRTVESLRLPISKDISTVTDGSTADETVVDSICKFIPRWIKKFRRLNLDDMDYHLTVKNGPNGPALLESDSDISAVIRDFDLFRAIQTVQSKLNDEHPMEYKLIDFVRKLGSTHSKLTQFPEKSGKTRTIAVVDYYSQRCLRPLHKGIMQLLSNMTSDGTYSHANVGKFAKYKTSEKSFISCFDLSAATDRFPRRIQEVLLHELIKDRELSSALWTILTGRTFKVAWSGENVTYNCGQPMGAYGSWPLFALAHHLVVEYCAYQANTKLIKDKYRLIGDDVIITDQGTSTEYQKVMKALGVDINLSKTVNSNLNACHSSAEVAKQLYLNGTTLTPLAPGFMRDLKKPYMFNTCMEVLEDRYEISNTVTPSVLIEKLFPKRSSFRKVWLLASDPYNGVIKPGDPGYELHSPWANKDIGLAKEVKALAYLPLLQNQARELAAHIASLEGNMDTINSHGGSTDQSHTASRAHKYVLERIYEQIYEVEGQLFPNNLLTIQEILDSFTYMPDPNVPFMVRKELKCKRLSSFKETCFKECPEVVDGELTKEDEFESWTFVGSFGPSIDSW